MRWATRARTWYRYRRHLRSLLVDERDRHDGPVPLERYEELKRQARTVAEYQGRRRHRRS